jgi:hypothetical protein
MSKPILCLDFDGVIHSYTSGWQGADVVSDVPVDGAMLFIWNISDHFQINIFSSRSNQSGGIHAMKSWLTRHFRDFWSADRTHCDDILAEIKWPKEKPAAFITIDDRALTFDGVWPSIDSLKAFKPWNKKEFGSTGQFPMGKVEDEDEGELRLGVAYDGVNGIVRLILKSSGVQKIEIDI